MTYNAHLVNACARHPGSTLDGVCERCGDFVCADCGPVCPECAARSLGPARDPRAILANAGHALRATLVRGVLSNVLPPWMLVATGFYGLVNEPPSVGLPTNALLHALVLVGVGFNAAVTARAAGAIAGQPPGGWSLVSVAAVFYARAALVGFVLAPTLLGSRVACVLLLVPAGYLWLRTSLAHAAAVVEGLGAVAALRRSWELTREAHLLVFAASFVVGVATFAALLATALASGSLGTNVAGLLLVFLVLPLAVHAGSVLRTSVHAALAAGAQGG